MLHHLDDTVGFLGEPNGDPLTVPNALLFREAAGDVSVVLNDSAKSDCFCVHEISSTRAVPRSDV